MIPLLLAPILTKLAENGLSVLAGAIQAKGTQVIEEKLGIKLPSKAEDMTPEMLFTLKQKEIEHEEFLVTAQIETAKLELEEEKLQMDNTKDAREMNARIQESDKAAYLSKVAAYYLDFIIVISTLLLGAALIFIQIPTANENLAYTIFGSLIALCGTVVNFHRGTSASSKVNGEALRSLLKKE